MRYIRQQRYIVTVSDRELSTIEAIRMLLNSIQAGSADIEIIYTDKRSGSVVSYDNTRIKTVGIDHIDIVSFSPKGTIRVRGISFNSIMSIKLVSDTDNILIGEKPMSKFDLLDIEDDTSEGNEA